MSFRILRPVAALLLGAVLGTSTVGCGHSESHHGEHTAVLPVSHPVRQDTETTREYVAMVHAIQHIEVRALEPGYLEAIHIDEGQAVREGQSLFQIRPIVYQAELSRAAAEVRTAEIEYENTRALYDRSVVSENELALSRSRLDKAKAERDLAKAHLGMAGIIAPFDGIMGRLEVRKGSLLDEGELLTTLSDNREMWVYFNVSEAEYLDTMERRRDGEAPMKVDLRLANGKLFGHPGEVRTIEADFNSETGTIAFRATFPNPDGLLRHGETGNVVVHSPLPGALIIPQKATFDILDKKFVYVVDEDDHVHMRQISIEAELPHLFVVGEGLSEQDRILIDGLRKVRDGEAIEAEELSANEMFEGLELHAE